MDAEPNAETSVLFSLAELAEIEQERIAEEERSRAAARAERERERARADEARRLQQHALRAAESEARAEREWQQAEANARLAAQEQAALEVARIQAESRARLEADNAARAHELALLGARTDRRGRRTRWLLAALLGASLLVGAGASAHYARRVDELQQESERARSRERGLSEARLDAHRALLEALDRKHAALTSSPRSADHGQARDEAARARRAIDAERVDDRALHQFWMTLERWEQAMAHAGWLSALDRRFADLRAWSTAERAGELAADARAASSRARDPAGGAPALERYARALDELAAALARASASAGRGAGASPAAPTGHRCTDPHDPMCGLDGKPL